MKIQVKSTVPIGAMLFVILPDKKLFEGFCAVFTFFHDHVILFLRSNGK